MIYLKFPQRYLAAIVFGFVLTLAALGAIFLIYLFNSDRSPLLLSLGSSAAVDAKPSMYFYGGSVGDDDINKYSTYPQHLLEQKQHSEVHLDNDDDDDGLETLISAESAVGDVNKLPGESDPMRKHRVRTGFMRFQERRRVRPTAPRLELKLRQDKESQPDSGGNSRQVHPQPPPGVDAREHDLETSEDISTDNELLQIQTSVEGVKEHRQQITLASKDDGDKYDTIYIDDFERLGSGESRDQGMDDANTDANNVNYLDALKVKDRVLGDPALITEAAAASNCSNVSKDGNHSKWSPAQGRAKKKKYRRQHSFLNANKSKKQKIFRKPQRRENSTNDVGRSSDAKQQLQQYSVQKIKKQTNFNYDDDNLDASYDFSHGSNYDIDIDDAVAGSGSGDFNNDDSDDDDDYDIDDDTANFIKRINLKMWRTMSGAATGKLQRKLRKQQQQRMTYPIQERNQNKRYNLNQPTANDGDRQSRYQNVIPSAVNNFYTIRSEIVSNLSTPQLYKEERILAIRPTGSSLASTAASPVVPISFSSASSSPFSSVSNKRINQISATVTTASVGILNNTKGGQGPLPLGDVTESRAMVTLMNASATSQQQQIDMARAGSESATVNSTIAGSGSAAWLETRTRRIMGNVKKSEERSRQLLLCEEAGGGELCRMLFKGHLNE